jgi:hypothetical protein
MLFENQRRYGEIGSLILFLEILFSQLVLEAHTLIY